DAWRVSGSVAAVDVVRPEHDPRELLRGEVQLVGRLGAAEDARERPLVERRAEAGRGALERLVPARRAQLSTVSDERRRQPWVLHRHEPTLDGKLATGEPTRRAAPEHILLAHGHLVLPRVQRLPFQLGAAVAER